MNGSKISLGQTRTTYLATLYGKAVDAAAEDSILGDRWAAEAVRRLDYDFGQLKLPRGNEITLPLRAWHFDQWTRAFLSRHPGATVLHLGCGLDTRVFRIDPEPEVHWLDVDLPEVIALREQLYPSRAGHQHVKASVTDPAWLDAVSSAAPVLVVAEGLFMYLPESAGIQLLQRIISHFPAGEVVFDGYSAAMVGLVTRLATVRRAQAELVWGVDDPQQLEGMVPGLRLLENVEFLALPELLRRLSKTPAARVMYHTLVQIRFYRRLVRHLRYGFGSGSGPD